MFSNVLELSNKTIDIGMKTYIGTHVYIRENVDYLSIRYFKYMTEYYVSGIITAIHFFLFRYIRKTLKKDNYNRSAKCAGHVMKIF